MSAVGLVQAPLSRPTRFIASHAEYRRSDFIFNRTQSLEMKSARWESRIKPMRTWGEIGTYGGVAFLATILATTLF
jgi:hypothetical protein